MYGIKNDFLGGFQVNKTLMYEQTKAKHINIIYIC